MLQVEERLDLVQLLPRRSDQLVSVRDEDLNKLNII